MQLTTQQVMNLNNRLPELIETKLPVRVAFQVAKIAIAIGNLFSAVETVRSEILRTGVEKDGEDKPVYAKGADGKPMEGYLQLTPEGQSRMKEMLEAQHELEAEPINVAAFGDLEIPPSLLIALEPILKLEE